MSYFFSRREDRWSDSLTYGDWHQYVCRRKDGALQCARKSRLPAIFTVLALLSTYLPIMAVIYGLNWSVVIEWMIVASALGVPLLVYCFSPYCLMVAVSKRQYDGRRVFSWEEN